ncbi:GerAB/ArcD/ProY family transporter [Carboxydothermus hydrogenoformans]|uniref:Spore germination protein n=1 Tax=Carboxydothermus hydrogenoformans (strain ATCC BAA-161 / DSM 6008 / Z-2901) TaxID=246194 RepID=Q3AC98_CARHZ|nr:GerAB/ArcD/ProY family transporter [Carboxydothermus hydrogenoformans]ABB14194.1 spore germination protein [Carboxydothermus hydrogenoformans Z-2901]
MKITGIQLLFIQFILILSAIDIFMPSVIAKEVGPDAWLSIILAFIFSVFLAWIYAYIGCKIYPDNLTSYLKKRGTLGKAILFAYFYLYFILIITVYREFLELVKVFLPQTPLLVIGILMQLVIFYGVLSGTETMARATEILTPFGIFALILVAGYALTKADFGNFKPFLLRGIFPVIKGSIEIINFFGDTLLLWFFAINFYSKPEKLFRLLVVGYFFICIALFGGVLGVAVFGVKCAAKMELVALEMVRIVNIADFLKHLDSVMLGVWSIGGVLKLTFLYLGLAELFKAVINVKKAELHILPLSVLALISAIYGFENMGKYFSYLGELTYFTLIFSVLIPLLFVFFLFLTKNKKLQQKI